MYPLSLCKECFISLLVGCRVVHLKALDSQERGSIEDSYLWKRTKTQNKSLNLITLNLAN